MMTSDEETDAVFMTIVPACDCEYPFLCLCCLVNNHYWQRVVTETVDLVDGDAYTSGEKLLFWAL